MKSLFELGPRRKPRVMMRLTDAGNGEGPGMFASFRCGRCGTESGWIKIANVTAGKRGVACPKCNPATLPTGE